MSGDANQHSIAEALRQFAQVGSSLDLPTPKQTALAAADEIERLEEQLESLRAAALPFAQPNDTTLAEYEALRAALYPAKAEGPETYWEAVADSSPAKEPN